MIYYRKIEKTRKTSSLDKSSKFDLSEIVKMNPKKIDLLKKYRGKINQKLEVYRQAENISNYKEKYQTWYDNNKNSPVKAPIFSKVHSIIIKMIYILERVNNATK